MDMAQKSGRGVRLVKVVLPPTVIKEEPLSEEEDSVTCAICFKSFASEMALRNHVMMEHFEAFTTNDPSRWTEAKPSATVAKPKKRKINEPVKVLKKDLMSIMSPGRLTALANEDVNYIIVKSEVGDLDNIKRSTPKKIKPIKKEKEKKKQDEIFKSALRGAPAVRVCVCGQVCAAVFDSNAALSHHTSVAHVKVKPFECEVCHKRFTTQVKTYAVVLLESFCQSVQLQQHMRHTPTSPRFECGVCHQKFKQASHRNYHLRYHNPADMSPEQREIYERMVGNAAKTESKSVQVQTTSTETEGVVIESTEQTVEEQLEQVIAEQSIQIVEGDEYIITEVEPEVEPWES
ncbi:hypothetical protein ACJJTC_009362 [Scirpophaga incertulas]